MIAPRTLRTLAALIALASACHAAFSQGLPPVPGKPIALVFDMPYGACRLMVHQDGSGFLAYGAAPAFVAIAPGSFDASALAAEFRSRIALSRDRMQMPEPNGSLRLSGDSEDLWFNNKEFAQSLFDHALKHRISKAAPSTPGPEAVVLHGCARQ